MSRVAVLGGGGFLGSHLCDRYVARGDEVICIDNFVTGQRNNIAHLLPHPSFTLVHQDITDGLHVPGPLDLVLHLASPASPAHYLALPIESLEVGSVGTRNAIELALRNDAALVLASTSEIYGDPLVHPQTEQYWGNVSPIGPRSVYDEAKRFAEAMTAAFVRTEGLQAGIARIFNTYGPRLRPDDGRVVSNFVAQALRGDPITILGDGQQTRSFCFVDDTIDALMALGDSGEFGPINIGSPVETTIHELAELVIELTGSRSSIEYLPLRQDDPSRRCPDIARAREALGWEPGVPLAEGLRSTIRWFADQGGSEVADPG